MSRQGWTNNKKKNIRFKNSAFHNCNRNFYKQNSDSNMWNDNFSYNNCNSNNSNNNNNNNNNDNNNNNNSSANSLASRISPATAEIIYLVLEIVIFLILLASIGLFIVAIWVASLDKTAKDPSWFLDSELYWNSAIFGVTLATVLLLYLASEKHLTQRERFANGTNNLNTTNTTS